MSVERHYFPGNNTPQGFFSYYRYILGQREASRIICIKGGPGTGKSTFIRKIGETFAQMGEDVDFLHCSADENSLDGIVLQGRKAAIVDGTSPHMTDPLNPGAVDKIMNLGEFWNEEGLSVNKEEIIALNEETSRWYRIAYHYLNAAKCVYQSMEEIYRNAAVSSEIYKVVANIVAEEYGGREISFRPGRVKKFFGSAITASGTVHYLGSLLRNMEKVYMINAPIGYVNSCFMDVLAEGAIYRGLDLECYYCAMDPEEKIEHILVPELKLAFVTVNEYHDMEPWEIVREDGGGQEIVLIDINDFMNPAVMNREEDLLKELHTEYDILLGKTVQCLSKAKAHHMQVEEMYIPNMNFTRISKLAEEVIEELKTKACGEDI